MRSPAMRLATGEGLLLATGVVLWPASSSSWARRAGSHTGAMGGKLVQAVARELMQGGGW
jgi:hypothetical protein